MLKEKIENGDVTLGTMISEFGCPNILRIMKEGGFEFAIIDGEHGPFNFSQFGDMIALANYIGLPILVRIPGIERGFITKVLDMGADGFLVPMVNTVEDARKLVEYAKYSPIGKRGLSTTRAHTNYRPPKLKEYMEAANRRTVLLVQMETKQAIENAEKIAAVQGIDALMIGPTDLTSDFGEPGNLKLPEFLMGVRRVADAARAHGKHSGTMGANVEYLHTCESMGMNVFCMGSELGMLLSAAKNSVKRFREKESV